MKKDKTIEAFVYLKNQKVVSVVGILTEKDNLLTFLSGEFQSVFAVAGVALVIKDDIHNLLEANKDKPLHGFEMYLESGTCIGFNGWRLDEGMFLSKQGDHIVLYEDIVYVKMGPEDPGKDPQVSEEVPSTKEERQG